jgi:DNA polymerase III alpha subunit
MKYMHLTMHAMDESAFFTMTRLLSAADDRAEVHGAERKPLFGWKELEELGSQNVTFCSSCLIGMVSRHILAHNDFAMAEKYYAKLRSLVKPGNFLVEVFPHVCDKYWESKIIAKYDDGTEEKFYDYKKVKTQAGEFKIKYLVEEFERSNSEALKRHVSINEVMNNRKWEVRESKGLLSIKRNEDFFKNECRPWAADGDVQLGVNRFAIEMANKYGDPISLSDDSHFSNPEDKLAQDVRLLQLGSWRFAQSHHRLTGQEAWDYCKNVLGVDAKTYESWVDNGYAWAEKFKGFKFNPRKVLPTSFYPENTVAHLKKLIDKHGRMKWNDPKMVERLKAEIALLNKNGTIDLLPYFFVCEEAIGVYDDANTLVGPGRGSAAGMLLSYLLGITHVDPLKYNLSMDRFITIDRIKSGKYPDIDMDYPYRDLLVDVDEEALEVEMEDGTKKVYKSGEKVNTTIGIVSIEEAVARKLEIL